MCHPSKISILLALTQTANYQPVRTIDQLYWYMSEQESGGSDFVHSMELP